MMAILSPPPSMFRSDRCGMSLSMILSDFSDFSAFTAVSDFSGAVALVFAAGSYGGRSVVSSLSTGMAGGFSGAFVGAFRSAG